MTRKLIGLCLLMISISVGVVAQDTAITYPTFTLEPTQARAVATLMNALAAYNAGDLDALSALLVEDVLWSDCDYAAGRAVNFNSRNRLLPWLEQRFAESDQFELGGVFNQNPDSNGLIIGIEMLRRTSTVITSAGQPDGIRPLLAPKVSFTPDGRQITRFANGPVGGTVTCSVS